MPMPVLQKVTGTPKVFRVSHIDDKHFQIVVLGDLNASQFAQLHTKISGFPERKFDYKSRSWLMPSTALNITYLRDNFSSDVYEIDNRIRLTLEYSLKTARVLRKKALRRQAFTDSGATPALSFQDALRPFDHQIIALDSVHNVEYFGLLMEMGTGKTKVLIDEIVWSTLQGRTKRVLIVCPKSVASTWVTELKKHLPVGFECWVDNLIGLSPEKVVQRLIEGVRQNLRPMIYIINYDKVKGTLDSLIRMNWDICIADESSFIKSHRTKRTKAMLKLAGSCKRRFILTGTAIGNTLLDLFAQFEFLQPGCLGYTSYGAFCRQYARFVEMGAWSKLVGYRQVSQLLQRVKLVAFAIKKADCLDLPPKIFETREVFLTKEQQRIYNMMAEMLLATLEGERIEAPIVLVQLLRLSQICCGFVSTVEGKTKQIPGDNPKLKELERVLEDIPSDTKITIWCRFRRDIKNVARLLKRMDIRYGKFTGKESEDRRVAVEKSFARDKGIRVLVGNPSVGGFGKTFIGSPAKPCSVVIYYSNDFSMLKRAQSEDRAHRIGTQKAVTYIDIVAANTVELKIAWALQEKKELNDLIVDYTAIKKLIKGK